jgi:hypothetical protein
MEGGQSSAGDDDAYDIYSIGATKTKPPLALMAFVTLVFLLVVGLVGFLVGTFVWNPFHPIGEKTELPGLINDGDPTEICPRKPDANERKDHPKRDGRLYGGRLSFPQLGSPWSRPNYGETRVPFGRDTAEQSVKIHKNKNRKGAWSYWVASLLVGELNAGDGFYSPEEGSKIVNKCIYGSFYGQEDLVTPEVLRSEAYQVDGYEGWYTETNLTFDIQGLPTKNEIAIVIIVRTSEMSSSIFFASIPGDAMYLRPDVEYAIANLRVHPN